MTKNKRYIATPSRTIEIMRTYDIHMKKSLGQNFLIEPNILHKMIETAKVDKSTTVIEIGPGIGALTEFLAINAKQVIAFEIDQRFIEVLQDTLVDYDNVQVIHQDILKVDFAQAQYDFLRQAQKLVVVANLPYYITTPIIMNLLDSKLPFNTLIMMMQKEVAERMTAQAGSKAYSSLSIAINNRMESQIAFTVPKNVFIPKPNVDSAVLKLTRRPKALIDLDDPKDFENFVQKTFTQRRKTLWNNLRNNYQYIAEGDLKKAFENANIEGNKRAESLSIQDFHRLYQNIKNID